MYSPVVASYHILYVFKALQKDGTTPLRHKTQTEAASSEAKTSGTFHKLLLLEVESVGGGERRARRWINVDFACLNGSKYFDTPKQVIDISIIPLSVSDL